MSSLSYLGSRVAPIYTVLVGSMASICTALASSAALKASDVGGMARPSGTEGTHWLSTLNSVVVTMASASSMLSCSQSSARCALASMVKTPVGPGILSLT
jgi:hypothetical protein